MQSSHPRKGWYVFQTKTKREHIAAAMIGARTNLRTFCPRIAFHRRLKRGKVKFLEALFPSYIFVLCEIETSFRVISHVEGVLTAVRYGGHFPQVHKTLVETMIEEADEAGLLDLTAHDAEEFEAGTEVEIIDGPFLNMKALVKNYDRPQERVRLLFDFLGRPMEVDLPPAHLISTKQQWKIPQTLSTNMNCEKIEKSLTRTDIRLTHPTHS